ncbi:MAG TPA: glycosyltransferase family 4 protein [Acidimicrobiia bacterium]
MSSADPGRDALRVALVCPYSLSVEGGVQLQVLGLARALRGLGVDARVLAPSDGPPPEAGITSLGPSRGFPSNGSIAPISSGKAVIDRTLEALRTFRPHVLHLHEPLSPGANYAALMATDIPAVGTFHAAHPGRNAWYDAFRLPLRKMVERLSVRTAVSAEAKRNAEAFGTSCEILPNGVEVDAYANADPWPSEGPAIVFVGRHERRKGLGVLLDAYARLDRDAAMWVAGRGPETVALTRRAPSGVSWLGRVSEDEKARRLRGATVACFPSIEGESFGVVLLEAMAAGTAVVASDLTGYRNVARDRKEARLVPPGDPRALADALRQLLDDPGERAALVERGRRRAAEFSMVHLAEAFLDRYETLDPRRTRSGAPL